MYGVIFDFLRDYVIERHGGKETWKTLLVATGKSPHKIYFPVTEYADKEIVDLAVKAAHALNLPVPVVLEDFGNFVGHKLVSFYHMYVKSKDWRTFDVIENASSNIHHAIHRHNPRRKPPKIIADKKSNDEIIVHYQSPRKLCHIVKGIINGLGDHFKEQFNIEHPECMHNGAEECVFRVTRIKHTN